VTSPTAAAPRHDLRQALAPRHIGAIPRPLAQPSQLRDQALAAMRYLSPLRYPGAKSGLAAIIAELITVSSGLLGSPKLFVEPFAGGASTALRLAGSGIVDRILLADADPLVTRFWQVAAADTEYLIDRMWNEPVTLERWDYWRSWHPAHPADRDVAVKCLFLNRTTFSGILHGRADRRPPPDQPAQDQLPFQQGRAGKPPAVHRRPVRQQPAGRRVVQGLARDYAGHRRVVPAADP
jgi:D12 class N6 adenine-specific DNA methyltransferase